MLPFDKAKSVQAHKHHEYSKDYNPLKSRIPGFSKRILSALRVSLRGMRSSKRTPKVA